MANEASYDGGGAKMQKMSAQGDQPMGMELHRTGLPLEAAQISSVDPSVERAANLGPRT